MEKDKEYKPTELTELSDDMLKNVNGGATHSSVFTGDNDPTITLDGFSDDLDLTVESTIMHEFSLSDLFKGYH